MFTIYGIPNCNTVKKARTWLEQNEIEYTFHDYKKKGITAEKLQSWFPDYSWDKLVNKAGTTWKGLTDEEKSAVTDEKSAINLMTEKTSVIKRPMIEDESGKAVALGFSEIEYEKIFL
ncbi:ArsC family reductase [Dyadobacter psychrotolerans]|uniref:ArsC family reductase n=1 Tax=Dyadobacter psychrotolerans TaxID=2541721 RepID=A0A4R5DY87_9BACT|nr:ArsC family reductase [Dyadobacter psychrotolerans]TDE16315.1 ArsC family reductase [Dyadobacter psychrotolerans]